MFDCDFVGELLNDIGHERRVIEKKGMRGIGIVKVQRFTIIGEI
tara:strand:+ start:1337 stop:1468 length:132 start_codon:yes stop_codon:yes gene_type:complete